MRDWASITLINWAPYPAGAARALPAPPAARSIPRKRLRLLADLQRQIRDWAPVVPLYQEVKVYAHGARVLALRPRCPS